jgi:hypothetical protein
MITDAELFAFILAPLLPLAIGIAVFYLTRQEDRPADRPR